ncbi:MAG TPA: signal peptidase I, partial [Thermoanaerobaculia bacterium]|nr:signal peptidase I [Thermoanaerobaculia bacterium]
WLVRCTNAVVMSKSLLRTILQPLAVAIGVGLAVRGAVHIYSIPSASMAPTLEAGDQIVVTRYFGGAPKRGDVIVFQSLTQPDELLVKRVVGVPGDLIDSRLGRVRVGGYTLPEPYVKRQAATGAIETQVVPSACYFVLGDNRDDSLDSRSWGVVPRDRVIGRARLVLWSWPGSDGVVRALDDGARRGNATHPAGRLFKWVE